MKRLCYIVPTLDDGALDHQVAILARGLAEDHEVTVVCTHRDGIQASALRERGIYIHTLDGWDRLGGWDFRIRRTLRAIFWRHRPDIVHSFLGGTELGVCQAARETGVPVVITHRPYLGGLDNARHRRARQRANELVDCIVANGQAVAEYAAKYEHATLDRFRVIINGVDTEGARHPGQVLRLRERFRLPTEGYIVGMAAPFEPANDHELFVVVAHELLRRRDDVHFLLAGTGSTRRETERIIRRMKLSKRITRIPMPEDRAALYAVLDVLAHTAQMAGIPQCLAEAMAAGCPVVAAAVGGIPELIEDGQTGWLIATRDPTDFAEAIDGLLDAPEARQAMGQRAAAYMDAHHSTLCMVQTYRALYTELFVRSLNGGG